jgi:hypothetical protein
MKILISEEQVKKVLLELKDTEHAAERLVERCLHEKLPIALKRSVDLGYGQTRDQIDKVGYYTFLDSDKNELKEKILKIFSYDYNKKSYGVVLQKFDLANRIDKIEFFGPSLKKMALDHMYKKGCGLYFVDFDNGKYDIYNREKFADAIALIIRENNAITAMWGPMFKFGKSFFRTDFEISKIDSLIKNGAIRVSEIPDRIKNIFNVQTKPEELPITQDTDNNDDNEDENDDNSSI